MLRPSDFRAVRIIEGVLLAALALAALALLLGWVRPAEVPGLLDVHVLSLFFVLIVAVECAKKSRLFAFAVRAVLARVHSARALAVAAVLLTGATAALVTNDVALLLVVPFTLAFEAAAPGFETAGLVVLEIASANLLGSLTPTGNPQNLFLFVRGGFTPRSFFGAQAPWVLGMAAATLLLVPLVVRERPLPAPTLHAIRVEPLAAAAALALLALELLAIFRAVPPAVPGAAALLALAVLGRDAPRADFSLVAVFAALFVGVEGLRRSALFHVLDPMRLFGASPAGFVLSGALLSQAVSNVPAALLLAPAAAAAPAGAFTALLYGVNAGGCGTPIASLANLIGARLYLAGRSSRRRFWRTFAAVSAALFFTSLALSLALVKYSESFR
jgi:Na+/H+ antiporter NhaD/arsenite permease-like protein